MKESQTSYESESREDPTQEIDDVSLLHRIAISRIEK